MIDYTKTGKFISLILRHNPDIINIKLDENGWADVNELINGINKKGYNIDFKILSEIVETNNKKRYSFSDDKKKIRANQGHSISVDVELTEVKPPEYLYHGTASRFIESIKRDGLNKKSRNHIHLSLDKETAQNVGKRHGKPYILKIETRKMSNDNYKFYLSENNVWLTENIPVQYIIFESEA